MADLISISKSYQDLLARPEEPDSDGASSGGVALNRELVLLCSPLLGNWDSDPPLGTIKEGRGLFHPPGR
jgi:hypothetical protein